MASSEFAHPVESEIKPTRLEAVPWAKYCLNCQELQEQGFWNKLCMNEWETRAGDCVTAILLFIFLILAGLDPNTHLFDLRYFKFETSLYFVSIIVLGLGAFFMFLFFSATLSNPFP